MARCFHFLLFWVVLVFAGQAFSAPKSGQSPTEIYQAGSRALAEVDSLLNLSLDDVAVELAQSGLKKYQNDGRLNWQFEGRLAVGLLRAGRPEEALPLLEKQVQLQDKVALHHRNLGACLLALGKKGRALSEYELAVDLEPRDFAGRLEFGQLLMEFRIHRDAQVQLLTAAELCGNCLEVQPALARYYMEVKNWEKAIDPLQRLWQETANPVARRNLLNALDKAGRDSELVAMLNESPADLAADECRLLLAAEYRLGRTESSLLLVGALTLEPEKALPEAITTDAVLWAQVSMNLMEGTTDPEALVAIDRAILLDGNQVVYRNNRVVLLQRLGRQDEAEEEWKRVLELDPSLERKSQP